MLLGVSEKGENMLLRWWRKKVTIKQFAYSSYQVSSRNSQVSDHVFMKTDMLGQPPRSKGSEKAPPPSFSFEFWFSSMLKQFCPWKVVHFRMRCYCPSLNWFCSYLFLRRFGPPTKLADQLCWSNPICSSELPNKSISYIYTLSNCLFWWFLLTNLSPNLTKSFNSCLVRSSKSKKKVTRLTPVFLKS